MRATELLTELANKPYPFRQILSREDTGTATYNFATDAGTKYEVEFIGDKDNLVFTDDKRVQVVFNIRDLDDLEQIYSPSKTGDEFRVMSTIIHIMQHYAKQHHPAHISWSTVHFASRKKLYDRLISQVSKWLPNYTATKSIGRGPTYGHYELTRTD